MICVCIASFNIFSAPDVTTSISTTSSPNTTTEMIATDKSTHQLPLRDCVTETGKPCVKGPWVWSERRIGQYVHFQNCVPMYGTGRKNIFDLKNNPNAKLKEDYDWYCPIALSEMRMDQSHNGINKGVLRHFDNFKKCVEVETNPHCKTEQTLEQTASTKLSPECKAAPTMYKGNKIEDCTNQIWRDRRFRWRRGCVCIGGRHCPAQECALVTNTEGLGIIKSRCIRQNSDSCNMKRPRLKRNSRSKSDFIYD